MDRLVQTRPDLTPGAERPLASAPIGTIPAKQRFDPRDIVAQNIEDSGSLLTLHLTLVGDVVRLDQLESAQRRHI